MSNVQLHRLSDVGPGLRLATGVPRSGKTYGTRAQVYRSVRAGVPVLALDRMEEWRSLPADLIHVAAGVPDMMAAKYCFERGAKLVIVRTRDVRADIDEACAWACEGGEALHRGIVVPEVHRACPNDGRKLPESVEDAALAWAHRGVSFWADTQRVSGCHRDFFEVIRAWRVHATTGRDREKLRELGGRELEEAALECALRLVAGEPGWYVDVRTIPVPPYQLAREP